MSTVTAPRKPRQTKKSAPVVSLALALDHQVYMIEPITGIQTPEITRAFRLIKKSDDQVYDVCRTVDGIVTCDCQSYLNTFADTTSMCKHGAALVSLGLLDAPSWVAPSMCQANADYEYDERQAAIESEAVRPKGDFLPDEEPAVASPGFADELAEAVGMPVIESPADAEPTPDSAIAIAQRNIHRPPTWTWTRAAAVPCCSPAESVPCGPCSSTHQAEPIGWAKPISPARKPAASLKPVKIAPLPDGTYSLAELVAGQAAMLRGQDNAAFSLMASVLEHLAAEIRVTGATSVVEFERIAALDELSRLEKIQIEAYGDGFCDGESQNQDR